MESSTVELYYQIVTGVSDHLEIMAAAFCLCLLCRGFFQEKKQIWITSFIYCVMMLLQYHLPVYMGGMNARIVAGAISFLYMVWSDYAKEGRRNIPVKAYLTFIFFTVEDLSSLISVEIYMLTSYHMDMVLFSAIQPESPEIWKAYLGVYCLNCFIKGIVKLLIMILFVVLLNKAFADKRGRYEWKEIGIILLPSLSGFIAHLVRRAFDDLLTESQMDLYGPYARLEMLISFHYIITLVIILALVFLSQNLRKKREEEKNRSLLQKQMQNIQSHISEIEHIYTGIRGIRHDLNNHIHVIGTLLEQKRYQDAENYLETMQGIVDTFEFAVKTGNPVTDIIINEKQREAEQKGIDFRSDFHYVQEGGLNVFDISVILNNALENAFEASCRSKDAYVSLYSERKKNVYLITVKNSYDGQLLMGTDDLPESMKDDRELHGFGLKNIRAVAEKYFGTFAIEQKEKEVVLTIMLIVESIRDF